MAVPEDKSKLRSNIYLYNEADMSKDFQDNCYG